MKIQTLNKRETRQLANEYLVKYSLDRLGWKVAIQRKEVNIITFGTGWKVPRNRRSIACCCLSIKLIVLWELASRIETVDSLKHEIAHIFTPNDNGHGEEWYNMAVKMGVKT